MNARPFIHVLAALFLASPWAAAPADAAKPLPFPFGPAVILKDLQGALSGAPADMTVVGNRIVYAADDGASGRELWVSDGTASGTNLLKDIVAGPVGSYPDHFFSVGAYAIFFASGGMYRTDGTAAGTFLIASGGLSIASVVPPVRLGPLAFIHVGLAGDGAGLELWRTDGTVSGTYVLKDIHPGTDISPIGKLIAAPELGYVFFTPDDGGTVVGVELWRSDGTTVGTVVVKDIFPGARSGISSSCLAWVNGRLWFSAKHSDAEGFELWTSDGTTTGTALLKDIETTTSTSSAPCDFTPAGNYVIFTATTVAQGREIWRSDGTATGTILLRDINPGVNSSSPSQLTAFGNKVVFTATDVSGGTEPWVTNGTPAGTFRLRDIQPGANGSNPQILGVGSRGVVFAADDGTTGQELWRTDGTSTGTYQHVDFDFGAGSGSPFVPHISLGVASVPFTMGNGMVMFRANSGGTDTVAGVSSGAYVFRIASTIAGVGISDLSGPVLLNGRPYFAANDGIVGNELWAGPAINPDVQRISVVMAGKSDVLFQHSDGRTHGWGVNGGSVATSKSLTAFGSAYRVKGVGDFNANRPDGLLLRDAIGNNRIVTLTSSMELRDYHDIVPAGLNWDVAEVADFDGDGRDDILWRDVGGYNHMFLQFNDSTGAVAESAVAGLGIDWKVAGAGDFDGDGMADIFWRNINGANAIWLMNGPAVKQVLNVAGLGIDWTLAGIADFDRDGRPDLLWRNIAGHNGIWFMNKNAVERVVNVPGVTPDWRVVGSGDYNGDGFADILWEQSVNGTRVVWMLDAGAYWIEAVLPGTGDIGWQVINPVSIR
jgi:ELWxxDGT repeat protein